MGPKTKELISVLEQLLSLLESEGEMHWLNLLTKSKSRIENSDYSGIELLLSFYGGMGSFSDLIICQSNNDGEVVLNKEYKIKNEKLNNFRSKAWQLADDIRHNQA